MAFPRWPDRLGPHCEFPPPDREPEPPPEYDPPTADPVQSPRGADATPWWLWPFIWLIALLFFAAMGALLLIGIPTRFE